MAIQHDHHTADLLGSMFSTTAEKTTAVVSVGMITAPLWAERLKDVSQLAALIAPILGCIYLSLQIGCKVWDRVRDDK